MTQLLKDLEADIAIIQDHLLAMPNPQNLIGDEFLMAMLKMRNLSKLVASRRRVFEDYFIHLVNSGALTDVRYKVNGHIIEKCEGEGTRTVQADAEYVKYRRLEI